MTGFMDDHYARWLIANKSHVFETVQLDNRKWLAFRRNDKDARILVIRRFQEMGQLSEWGYDYVDNKDMPL